MADIQFQSPPPSGPPTPSGSNGSNGIEARLRNVERAVDRIEARYEYLAKREDIANLKTSLLMWMVPVLITTIGVAASITFFISR